MQTSPPARCWRSSGTSRTNTPKGRPWKPTPSTDTNTNTDTDRVRTVRIETELRFRATPERVFAAVSGDTSSWFPHSYGEGRTLRIVMEPRVGGAHFEDWGEGQGYLYGHVTEWDPPRRISLRGRVMPGTLLDTTYEVTAEGDGATLRMSKVAVGPMSDEEAAGVRRVRRHRQLRGRPAAVVED